VKSTNGAGCAAGYVGVMPWLRWFTTPTRGRGDAPLHQVGSEPDYRFSLANERTFLAWIRTALALLAGGIAVVQIVPSFSFGWARHVLGIALILLAIVIAATSYARWERRERAIRLGAALPPSLLPRVVGLGIALVMTCALAFILVDIARGHR
jgi:putative membrane protein